MTLRTMSAVMPSAAALPSVWVSRPWIDLLVGCGGWSLPLLALSFVLTGDGERTWAGVFYGLALVSNYPHYMATVYRAYGAADRTAHRAYTVFATLALVAAGVVAHLDVRVLPVLFTAYVVWSPWHYSGQNFGLLMMFAKRGQLPITPTTRWRLRAAFVASYVMLLAAFNDGPSNDPTVLSLAVPSAVARVIGSAAGAAFVVCAVAGLVPLLRGAHLRVAAPPALLLLTQALWFVAPVSLAWLTGAATPQTRYSSGMLALMHSAQYLWITQYFARREHGAQWSMWRYWFALVVGGMALFLPVPWLASVAAHVDFTASVLIVTAVVNLHHFMIDGVVWRLRDPRVARALTDVAAPTVEAAMPAAPPWWRRAAVAVAALSLAALAGLDQWRYRLTRPGVDPAALAAAVRVNPYDAAVRSRLLRELVERGDAVGARTLLDDLIVAAPRDVNLRVNAGVLAHQDRRVDDAIQHWSQAVALDPALPTVRLYLAEALDERGRAAEALGHYRAYLEQVAAAGDQAAYDPAAVVPVVVKFGDALARAGHAREARSQFELAVRMAQQTGLSEVEQAARERLATPP